MSRIDPPYRRSALHAIRGPVAVLRAGQQMVGTASSQSTPKVAARSTGVRTTGPRGADLTISTPSRHRSSPMAGCRRPLTDQVRPILLKNSIQTRGCGTFNCRSRVACFASIASRATQRLVGTTSNAVGTADAGQAAEVSFARFAWRAQASSSFSTESPIDAV